MARHGPLRIQSLEGSPITIGETTLIPQAQLVTWGRRRGTVTRHGLGAWGWACGVLIPRAVIEQRGGQGQRTASICRIPIRDRTGQAVLAMAVVGLAAAVVSILVQMFILSVWAEGKGH